MTTRKLRVSFGSYYAFGGVLQKQVKVVMMPYLLLGLS
jgi:hypothetical protein